MTEFFLEPVPSFTVGPVEALWLASDMLRCLFLEAVSWTIEDGLFAAFAGGATGGGLLLFGVAAEVEGLLRPRSGIGGVEKLAELELW